ncbi:MAG TPA: glycine oxidase ThiO [Terriglobales bacterium]
MKSWDAIVVGAGIIGLSLAIALRKQGLRVLVVERAEPGHEASWAAAGMLVGNGEELPLPLRTLAVESSRMYPEFVHELEDESGQKIDFRDDGTIFISREGKFPGGAELLTEQKLEFIEPAIAFDTKDVGRRATASATNSALPLGTNGLAAYVSEHSVDPRSLLSAGIKAARHRGVDISSGTEVKAVLIENSRATGVKTDKTSYAAPIVVNCAGAWAACIAPYKFPVRPVKGQMLAVVGGPAIKHVIRGDEVYMVPRSDGRIVIGSTLEDAGYDKKVNVETIQRLFQAAVNLVPELSKSRKHEDWAGLRPGTPDELPILGETDSKGHFIASGHYRDGILLAPVTAKVMTDLILNKSASLDLSALSPARFSDQAHPDDIGARRD